jgi:5'-phosphate synthase pdxT subunit
VAARRATTGAPVIGVLALQGDFREHLDTLASIGAQGREVRLPADLAGVDGLILPGGESTAMRKLLHHWKLVAPIRALAAGGAPIFGTCAGAILLARKIADGDEPVLSLLDVEVQRNAFGRQLESFEETIDLEGLRAGGGSLSLRAVFIRAPEIVAVGPGARAIARLSDGRVVAARQGNVLGIAFHPEIAGESRIHRWLVGAAADAARRRRGSSRA